MDITRKRRAILSKVSPSQDCAFVSGSKISVINSVRENGDELEGMITEVCQLEINELTTK